MVKGGVWAWALCLCCLPGLAACGRPTGLEEFQAGDETPPATAGSLEALVGTTWELSRGQTLTFQEGGEGIARQPTGLPMTMRYELKPNGVIAVTLPGASRSGTWDGTRLVLGGQAARPLGASGASGPLRSGMPSPEDLAAEH